MIKISYCPKCYRAPKVETVKHIRGKYCTKCQEWGEVAEFRYMHLAQMWIRWRRREARWAEHKAKQGVGS